MGRYAESYTAIETSTAYETVIQKGKDYTSPSVKTFEAYSKPLSLSKGDGQYLWDTNGKKYIDLMAQNLCISVGYCHPLVNSEARKQMDSLTHSTAMYVHPVAVHYAQELAAKFPAGHDWVVQLVNSGAEAIDVALMMARVYTGNNDMLALRTAYHGVHGPAMSLTGIHTFHQNVPLDPGVLHVANPHPYRGIFGDSIDGYLDEIERTIESSTPGEIAGFMVEPIQGFGGVIPMPEGYLSGAFERVRAAGGLCIVDEIQTGFSRTGEHFWGFQADDVVPDIIVLGKGIGNGFPLSAVVAKREVAEAMARKKWFNTYGSNPISCAAGRAVLRAIDEDGTQQNAKETGAYLKGKLEGLMNKFDIIGDVRGRGLMMGVELVTDRTSKKPAENETARVVETAKDLGVVIGKGGALGNILRINPPLCIQKEDMDNVVEILDESFRKL
ncbi:MAG: aspartate aminotransferase family protein [Deltaproteobacteria bacterium]|nr:aspartate aminotransferase family protein [Deltaproteobacteria bacterium]MBT4640527.1 aspartate aminotransferase family protein [Deltaproteobacteria bacterium]MBT6499151.1 aspartate aminotransferase family protein [Deltaproteobacteria bacterium]MBT7713968.1 aspartate aminotransferase family protein [Deltaproteobacteria bacterium]